MSLVRLATLLLPLFATFYATQAMAQAPSEASVEERDARARALYQAGEAAFNVGHYESAMELFLEAYSLSNRSALLYNLGHTADRLRRDDDAIRYFERFLAEANASDTNRLPATQRLAALQQAAAARALATQQQTAEAERLAALAAEAEARRVAEAEAARAREAELAAREAAQLAERQDAEFRAIEAEARAAQASRQAEESARQAREAERLAEEARRQQQGQDLAQDPVFWVVLIGGLALAGGGVALGLVLTQPQRVLGDDGESHPALTVRF